MVGATIANEIRVIAAGLAGKKDVQLVQVKDLMIDLDKERDNAPRSSRGKSTLRGDMRAAQSYYKAWERSIESRLKHAEKFNNRVETKKKSKRSTNQTTRA